MPDSPLGITDLLSREEQRLFSVHRELGSHWYWCRQHEQVEHASEERRGLGEASCVLVGPFMTEAEAGRLDGENNTGGGHMEPLGMEIEG